MNTEWTIIGTNTYRNHDGTLIAISGEATQTRDGETRLVVYSGDCAQRLGEASSLTEATFLYTDLDAESVHLDAEDAALDPEWRRLMRVLDTLTEARS